MRLRIVLFVFIGAFSGLFLSAYYLAHTPYVQAVFTSALFDELGTILGCSCKAQCKSLNFITGNFSFDVVCDDPAHRWRVRSAACTVSVSWIKSIVHRSLFITLTLDEVTSFSHVSDTGEPLLAEPLKRWLALTESPIQATVSAVYVRHAQGTFVLPAYQGELSIQGAGDIEVGDDAVYITGACAKGEILLNNRSILRDMQGSLRMAIAYQGYAITADAHLIGVLSYLAQSKPQCRLTASWSAQKKEILARAHEAFARISYDAMAEEWLFSGIVPSAYGFDIIGIENAHEARGMLQFSGKMLHEGAQAEVHAEDLVYAGYSLPCIQATWDGAQLKACAHYQEQVVHATAAVERADSLIRISWHTGAACALPYVGCCATGAVHGTLTYAYERGELSGACVLSGACREVNGTIAGTRDMATITLQSPEGAGTVYMRKAFSWYISDITATSAEGARMQIKGSADGAYQGMIEYEWITQWARRVYGADLVGKGVIQLVGQASWHALHAEVRLDEGQVHIPTTYLVLTRCGAHIHIDRARGMVTVRQAHLALAQGMIEVPEAVLYYDRTYMPTYLHAPLVLKNCFVHWKKDIVGEVSGFLVACYQKMGASLRGHMVFDKAYVQSNVLSADFKKQFMSTVVSPFTFSHDAALEVTIATRQAVAVKTPFLETACALHFGITGTLSEPHIVGSLELTRGVLQFPYEPLYLTVGRLYFLPNQLDDPLIELTAQNTIKKYAITMNVAGSLSHPRITFDSSPTLTQGQIITLLLGGSDDGSLYLALPSSLMTNLENLIFGPAETSSIVKRSIRTLFKPLKHVRLVPSFSDEYGRGGLRGSLVIEVNDRLKATIQQNFTLTEDTRYDLDYALSDTMSVRVLKDERRDFGAEFEKVWKFS